MKPIEQLIEISQYTGTGYRVLVNYEGWRVAILNFIEELLPENIAKMQRHEETDEVFVLLSGRCILFLGDGDATIERIHAVDMEPMKIYNVKKNCWHTHTLDRTASVLIVENLDTGDENSSDIDLTPQQKSDLAALTRQIFVDVKS
ncbi:MAG: hypothetical protein EHM70_22125 [Chloroflexota bacterium]|nr:MAG: hypothetical protein EHM70_22125 [Chloroflexota bacterium]